MRVPVSRWLMQEKYNDTGFILVPAKEAVRPAEREPLYYLHHVLVGDTSLSERGRGAPNSLDVLGVIKASANISGMSTCVLVVVIRPSPCADTFLLLL